ncbi:hypothetical protein HAX54_001630 [Datura stramonium]|uniref:Uncharacterized protein n=1 Tax=Datura stramonium TaxID=4076 RepID=A0ABS8T3N0_DATST|nr:hypothetical protein [Datura stramonium]
MPLPTCTSGYAVGILIGDKLRPSQQHLKESELKKNITTSNDEKSKPPGNNKDIGELWLHLKYNGARSDISAGYLQKMAMEEGSPVPFSMSPPADTDRFRNLTRLSQLPLEERVRTWASRDLQSVVLML